MAEGMTGNLDEIYPEVVGPRNGWLGGDGGGWERGPHWKDGLLPLAYALDDDHLKAKAHKWIEWTINNQSESDNIPNAVAVVVNPWDGSYSWNLENAPFTLKMKGLKVPEWKALSGFPYFLSFWGEYSGDTAGNIQEITLVPYGCTTLRISQFPTYTLN